MKERKYKLPGPDTQAFHLLQLIAISGEFPATLLTRLAGGASYKEAMVYKLKKDGLLHTYYRDRLRSYRLTPLAKSLLMAEWRPRFQFYLTGNADTNRLKSEITRRLRQCRIASTYVNMLGAGILVFRDSKPAVFRQTGEIIPDRLGKTAFYSSREIKEIGAEAVKIRGARLVGVVLSEDHIFVTYNNNVAVERWDYQAEMRAKVLLKRNFCQLGSSSGYSPEVVCGLLFSDGMEPLYQLLTGAGSGNRRFFLMGGIYEHFYYLTNDRQGERLLNLLCDREKTAALNTVLRQGLGSRKPGGLIEHDALDLKGNPVLFNYFLDMPRMVRFTNALQLHERQGTVVCFDFQSSVLNRCFGGQIEIQAISFEKFERRFYP